MHIHALNLHKNVLFLCVCVCRATQDELSRFLNVLDNEQMLQKLGKKHLLLPAVPLWPVELQRTGALTRIVLPGAPGAAAGEH